ncbi:hypothetical protein [Halalkalicoccus tibetensis]|uniref:Uncharacterized protein n=1 Tax=Halalkalicoccus tibetensis TaxID=175632 RepID=A0ABD5V0P8_9EURY
MDDTALLEALREVDPATTEGIARGLGADPDAVDERLSELESIDRVERDGDEWRIAGDSRLDSSVEHMADRLGSEGERR